MNKRKRPLTHEEIQTILFATDSSDNELSSEDDGWPTVADDRNHSFIFDNNGNNSEVDEAREDPLPEAIVESLNNNEEDESISWQETVNNLSMKPLIEKYGGGPVHNLPVGSEPIKFFQLLCTHSMCEEIKANTNKYAEFLQKTKQKINSKWKPMKVYKKYGHLLRAFL